MSAGLDSNILNGVYMECIGTLLQEMAKVYQDSHTMEKYDFIWKFYKDVISQGFDFPALYKTKDGSFELKHWIPQDFSHDFVYPSRLPKDVVLGDDWEQELHYMRTEIAEIIKSNTQLDPDDGMLLSFNNSIIVYNIVYHIWLKYQEFIRTVVYTHDGQVIIAPEFYCMQRFFLDHIAAGLSSSVGHQMKDGKVVHLLTRLDTVLRPLETEQLLVLGLNPMVFQDTPLPTLAISGVRIVPHEYFGN